MGWTFKKNVKEEFEKQRRQLNALAADLRRVEKMVFAMMNSLAEAHGRLFTPPKPATPEVVRLAELEGDVMEVTLKLPQRTNPTAVDQKDIIKGVLTPIYGETAHPSIDLEVDIPNTKINGIPRGTMLSGTYFWVDAKGLAGAVSTMEPVEIDTNSPPPKPGAFGVEGITEEEGD